MKTIYLTLIQLFLNCALCLNNKAENESSVTTTRYITQTKEYSYDQRTTLAKSSILNTANFYTSAKSASTYSNLVEELRNVSIENTAVAKPIEPCSAEGNCILTKSMEHQFCH
jgi:cation transport regulator ChaC